MKFLINDMTCGHCVGLITKTVEALDPRASVEINLPAHLVSITSNVASTSIGEAIKAAGYTPILQTA
jgi:copper chaperone